MDTFEKTVAGILVGLVLWICLQRQEKDVALVLSVSVCAMGIAAALKFTAPVFSLLRQLQQMGQMQEDVFSILLKTAGVGLVTELAGMICSDAGNSAMEKTIRILGSVSILVMAIPLFESLLKLIQEILGTV